MTISKTFILTNDVIISAVLDILECTVTIEQSDNQLIIVTANGIEYTDTFTAPYGTEYTASIIADEGYTAGILNFTEGIITRDMTIKAVEAVELPDNDTTIYYAKAQKEADVIALEDPNLLEIEIGFAEVV